MNARLLVAVMCLGAVASPVLAQGTKTKATGTNAPARGTAAPATKSTTTKGQAAGTKAAPPAGGQTKAGMIIAPESAAVSKPPVIMRETFDYSDGGRRDPFFSLLPTAELRPTVSDLRLVGILYDESGRRPVAVMRDILTNTQYRVTTGMTLGRMRVALIKRRAVIFNIEEFGLNRQDSLVLGDTSKARAR